MTGKEIFSVGFAVGAVAMFLILRVYWNKEIAIAKQLYAAGYTKVEQIAAFIKSRV